MNLQKGQSISIAQDEEVYAQSNGYARLCFGVSWGGIIDRPRKVLGVRINNERAINLDVNCIIIYPDEPFDH
ncbi:MAG: hypothetical protein AAFU03_07615, partial [Bacteroidota bacterium]